MGLFINITVKIAQNTHFSLFPYHKIYKSQKKPVQANIEETLFVKTSYTAISNKVLRKVIWKKKPVKNVIAAEVMKEKKCLVI